MIDGSDNLCSSSGDAGPARLIPPVVRPPSITNWQVLYRFGKPYGIAVDPLHPYNWQTPYEGACVWLAHPNGIQASNFGLRARLPKNWWLTQAATSGLPPAAVVLLGTWTQTARTLAMSRCA